MSVMSVDQRRYNFLCHESFGSFYWDNEDKMVVMETPGLPGQILGAGAYVVKQDRLGYWSAKRRPVPRLDLDVLRAERETETA